MTPIAINRHRYLPTAGVGGDGERSGRERRPELPEPWVYVGRGTPLGNPFRVGVHGDRTECLRLYRRHLYDRIRANDRRVWLALRSITHDAHLVCSCAPAPCHADVVVSAWVWLRERGAL